MVVKLASIGLSMITSTGVPVAICLYQEYITCMEGVTIIKEKKKTTG